MTIRELAQLLATYQEKTLVGRRKEGRDCVTEHLHALHALGWVRIDCYECLQEGYESVYARVTESGRDLWNVLINARR